MNSIPVYLLAGGQSARFGSDKARAQIRGVPLIARLAQWLGPIARPLTVVAQRVEQYRDLGLSTIADLRPGMGPLGGVHTALAHAGAGWTLIASCDILELRLEWLNQLEEHTSGPASAVVFRDRCWQPFPGLYHTKLLSLVEQNVTALKLSMIGLLEQAGALGIGVPGDWPVAVQANTRAELEAYAAALPRG